ncbi:helix-turn-helix transcriptional regulator [Natrononativus amylolyticus]|uniref:helix-turn-helix transcriptional regulator n=1 Tax=Natrononativus amylolyticus TaxID=2963434 RepID=UPI0020CBDF55|nr:GntR family transcriptional regulator [Natrononativus amylolyticus]
MPTDSLLDVFGALHSRIELFGALEHGPLEKPELEAALGCSRSTVDRAVRDLESAGLLTRTEGGYELTLYGRLLVDRYLACLDDAAEIVPAGPLLSSLPPEAPMAATFLDGASVVRSTPPVPHQPVSEFERLLGRADRLRGLSCCISQSTTPRLLADRVLEGSLAADLVVCEDLASYALEPSRRACTRALLETEGYRLHRVESLPYGLVLLEIDGDHRVVLFVYGDENDVLGTIHNDTPEAVAWAESVYERYRADAETLSADRLE